MKEKLKELGSSIWYGLGAVGLDLSYGMFYTWLSIYLTDILQLNIVFLLVLAPLARIWDGINDPMMGSIVDNTKTKFGKYRPWVIIGAVANAVVLFFLFTDLGIRGIPLYILITILYIGWGMTNTMADIPYWSMVPSFTSDPTKRSIISTVARAFSGLGQGIILIGAPILLPLLSKESDGNSYDAQGFSRLALICGLCLIFFAVLSMTHVKENHVIKPAEKFTFKKVFTIARNNDQLLVFMLFAMLSNAGYYMISGVAAYYFKYVVEDTTKQSLFSAMGSVGAILGLLFLPIMMKYTSRRRTYQASLIITIVSYIGMFFSGMVLHNVIVLDIFYLISSIGTGSMFVSQTVFLADIVDYGEVKLGYRAESITFSMKGFLQKMAYTIQVIILFAGLGSNYSKVVSGEVDASSVKGTINIMMLVLPALFFIASLIIFSTKFKLHGEFMQSITDQVTKNREED
ncbi:MAG: glycoside-pentoside-hexuronide (GPH):cation symporter [Oscillospiraceae bacterium]|nr:glycoside-pentoside-hexuronide (GPH):cation symporter [Oscillospiraceae bacterium]